MSLDPSLKHRLDSLFQSRIAFAKEKPSRDFDRDTWKYDSAFDFWYGHVIGEMFVQFHGIATQYYRENYGRALTHADNAAISALLAAHARDLRDALKRLKQPTANEI